MRVFILDNAETMRWDHANIFLKILEEPPESATLILMTPNPFLLLPTIRSRCLQFQFAPLEERITVARDKTPVLHLQLELAVRGSTLAIWEVDMPDGLIEKGRVTVVNALEPLGYDPAVAPTDFGGVLALSVHPEDQAWVGRAVQAYLAGETREFDVELFSFLDDGETPEAAPLLEFCARVVCVRKRRYREPRWSSIAPPEVNEFLSPAMDQAIAAGARRPHNMIEVRYGLPSGPHYYGPHNYVPR